MLRRGSGQGFQLILMVITAVVLLNWFTFHLGPNVSPGSISALTLVHKFDGRRLKREHTNYQSILHHHINDSTNCNCNTSLEHTFCLTSTEPHTKHTYPWEKMPTSCRNKDYNISSLPKVSIVIAFHDGETLVNILHTLYSVVDRTPDELIEEIILVDDNSKKDELKSCLDVYAKKIFSKVFIIRSKCSLGLIKARDLGIQHTSGDVIIVMDSHMEPQEYWLEALLETIQEDNTTLASSYLDWMYKEASGMWTYKHGASSWKTYFDWNLIFGFQEISLQDKLKHNHVSTSPIRSPITIGGIWAMKRSFYHHIGGLDTDMKSWGGENIELALKVWLFGGRVVNVPCSHVAHLETSGTRAYRTSLHQHIQANYRRVVDVWFDEYKTLVYHYNPALKIADPGDLTEKLHLKPQAKHNFQWFLDHVYPELGRPDSQSLAYGGLRNLGVDKCISGFPGSDPRLGMCNRHRVMSQGYYWSDTGELRYPVHVLTVDGYSEDTYRLVSRQYITLYGTGRSTKWIHSKGDVLKIYNTEYCLTAKDEYTTAIVRCNATDSRQRWQFLCYSKTYQKLSSSILPKGRNISAELNSYLHNLRNFTKTTDRDVVNTNNSLIYKHNDQCLAYSSVT